MIKQIWNSIQKSMYALDWYFILMLSLYLLLTLIFWSDVPDHWSVVIENTSLAVLCFSIIYASTRSNHRVLHIVRTFYVVPLVYPMYAQTFVILPYVRTTLYDQQLIALDHWLLGVNPTQWIAQFSHPVLTEYFQMCYVAFFFLPTIHAVMLFRDGRMKEVAELSRMMVFSFFISYVAYFGFPAVGPRFTLHEFSQMNSDLPGLFVTSFLRERVNLGGGVIPGSLHPELLVNRDCMPSGHTMMTLINIILVWRFRSRAKWFFTIVGSSLIVATLYLRYHYLVDILAGIICALTMLPLEPAADRFLKRHKLIVPGEEV